MSSGPNPRVHPAACAEQPEPKEETDRKCADEKKATALRQLLYFDGGATQSRTGLNGFATLVRPDLPI